ncbi:VPLPA-CTERM sorting domain-containing protein [Pseudotabrizicola sediminis]|uniref:VPLPA-CTERM sorting domain-containing protein n=1 Tax=Pseudotabrizicola sediminis TaxID=2486418 RepID=UPI001FD8D32C|nr:VPLPA-CTERM sorting domain-containing protein [Pseudotabrizicola sediminis]
MGMKSYVMGAAAGLAFAVAASTASATICNIGNFTTSTACLAGIPGGTGGNVKTGQMNGFNAGAGVFGYNEWSLLTKLETNSSGGTSLDDDSPLAVFSLTSNPGNSGGMWSLIDSFSFATNMVYAFVLKGSGSNVAYLLNTAASQEGGKWTNLDLFTDSENNAGLSNISLFSAKGDAPPPPPTIPLPAAGWLMIAGLGGLAALRRRKRA